MKIVQWIKKLSMPLRVFAIAILSWLAWEIGLLIFLVILNLTSLHPVFGYLFLFFIVASSAGFFLTFVSVIIYFICRGVKKLFKK